MEAAVHINRRKPKHMGNKSAPSPSLLFFDAIRPHVNVPMKLADMFRPRGRLDITRAICTGPDVSWKAHWASSQGKTSLSSVQTSGFQPFPQHFGVIWRHANVFQSHRAKWIWGWDCRRTKVFHVQIKSQRARGIYQFPQSWSNLWKREREKKKGKKYLWS